MISTVAVQNHVQLQNNTQSNSNIELNTNPTNSLKPIAGHSKDFHITDNLVAKSMDQRELFEYENLPENLKSITPKLLSINTGRYKQLENKKNGAIVCMEPVFKGIAIENLIELDVKLGAYATKPFETLSLEEDVNKANKKVATQREKSEKRGAPDNCFTLDGSRNPTQLPGYTGYQVITNKDTTPSIFGIEENINLIPLDKRNETIDVLNNELGYIRDILEQEANTEASAVSYAGSSLLFCIDKEHPINTKVKLIDLGHPIRPIYANQNVSSEQLNAELKENSAEISQGINNLIKLLSNSMSDTHLKSKTGIKV